MINEAVTVPGAEIVKDEAPKPPTQPNLKVIGGNTMPKGTKNGVYVPFPDEASLALKQRLEADAAAKRYDLGTYILLVLEEAYKFAE